MVKLIRLESDDPSGLFNNNFATDISVDENNQIALQSCSFSAEFNTLKIDGTNDNVIFEYTSTLSSNVNLTHNEKYDQSNKDDLFADITTQLNKGLTYQAGKTIGLQFLSRLTTSTKKASIGYRRSNFLTNNDRTITAPNEGEFINMEFVSSKYRKTDATNSINDECKYFSRMEWGQGCMIHRLRIVDYVDTTSGVEDNGLILGLSNVAPINWENSVSMTAAQKTYYIKFVRGGAAYKYKVKNGTEQSSTINPDTVAGTTADNDIIEIVRDGDRIKGFLYRQSQGAADELFDVEQTDDEKLYPFITVQGGQNNIKFNLAAHTVNPYHPRHLENKNQEPDILHANPPPSQRGGGNPTDNTLELQESVASFLGFNNLVNGPVSEIAQNFIADNVFKATLSATSFIIELRNLEIDSYNGKANEDGQRQNIIAVVNNSLSNVENAPKNAVIEYEPNNLYYVNIKQKTNIRNLKCRILRIDGARPDLTGLSVLTFLIK